MWKTVELKGEANGKTYATTYRVNELGDVQRQNGSGWTDTAHVWPHRSSYRYVRHTYVGRIVLTLFDRSPDEDEVAWHKNGKKHDDRLANLEWVSRAEARARRKL
jgi:hypothetical protein